MTALASAPAARRREPRCGWYRRPVLVAVPLVLLLSACGTADENTSTSPRPADGYGDSSAAQSGNASPDASSTGGGGGGTVIYRVVKYTFADLAVAPGTRVDVINEDDEPHTVTAEDGSFDTGAFDGDDPGAFTAPTKPGTYRITCTVHPSMHGQITVR